MGHGAWGMGHCNGEGDFVKRYLDIIIKIMVILQIKIIRKAF